MGAQHSSGGQGESGATGGGARVDVTLRPERRLIERGGCSRHVDMQVRVRSDAESAGGARPDRSPLGLALVLDRSGSMQGEKLQTAKRAALAVLDALDERDTLALVIFDDKIETIQPAAPVTAELKARVREALATVEARSRTALHEGWLTGCRTIAPDERPSGERLARCFLLTDGLANVGLTDPEQIASQAAGIREKAGISTSAFGIGLDYSEELLGPLAQAGGGAFHHLRTAGEIASAFVGELGQLLAIAAAQAQLEIEVAPGVTVDVVSGYYAKPAADDGSRWTVALGDLLGGEEHHVVVALRFPAEAEREEQMARARLTWSERGVERETWWHETRFTYATDAECAAEQPDPDVLRYVGQHLSDRAHRDSIRLSKSGNLAGAHAVLDGTVSHLAAYAQSAPELEAEVQQLRASRAFMERAPMPSHISKERYYKSQQRSSGKRDLRTTDTSGNGQPPDGQSKP
jgi:Ca-activated chloride channel family protein